MAPWFRRRRESAARAERVMLEDIGDEAGVDVATVRRRILVAAVGIVGFVIVLELVFPGAMPRVGIELQAGQIAREEITAPFDFDVLKSQETLTEERENAASRVIPVFEFDSEAHTESRKRFGDFVTRVYGIREGEESRRQKLDLLSQLGVALSDSTREILLDAEASAKVEERAREILFSVHERGILRTRGAPELSPEATVMLIRDGEEAMVRLGQFVPRAEVDELVRREAARSFDDRGSARAAAEITLPFVSTNVTYDSAETERRRTEARDAISEFTGRDFKKDEVIVERGERITPEHITILHSMALKRNELLNLEPGPRRFLPPLGRALEAALLLGAFLLYISLRRTQLLFDPRCQLLLLLLVAIVMVAAASVAAAGEAAQFLVPIAVLAMLAAMLFSFEFAIVACLFTVILAAIYTGLGTSFVMISVVAGVVAAHSVRRVRHREDFYWSAIRVVAAYAAAILVADMARAELSLATLTRCGWGGLNAIVSMGIVVVALPLFERGFHVTTDITLLELADMNKPLLRKMAMTAPGSYHHSIVVGNLAEAAAEAIGANGLLARVGSYYHDIGKLVTPGYFVENQQGLEPAESKHTGVRPKVSSLVIKSHIKDGVELARKEGLPEPIIDIIREHHGTSVMEYFYNKALEEAEDADEVTQEDYSYPGPRPRSRESAIISLADAIEARIRSIGEALTPKRVEAEVAELVEKRWRDHQLDDSELTLSDLRRIREAFSRVLIGMYHQRIKYPDQVEDDEGGDWSDGEEPTERSPERGDGD
jgi:putative nucleotidyltransferase with HDIG domain